MKNSRRLINVSRFELIFNKQKVALTPGQPHNSLPFVDRSFGRIALPSPAARRFSVRYRSHATNVRIIRRAQAVKKHQPLVGAFLLAGPTGFEPAIFSVTGRRDRPLHYEPSTNETNLQFFPLCGFAE